MGKMDQTDIYNREGKNTAAKGKLYESGISQRNKNLILEFLDYKTSEEGISIGRQTKYLCNLRIVAECLDKPFDEITQDGVKTLLKRIFSRKVKRGGTDKNPVMKPMSQRTKEDYAIQLKTLFRYMEEAGYPVKHEWVKIPKREKPRRLRPDEIITWEDAVKLSKSAMNPRDRALPQVLWECGGRIEELLTLLLRDVESANGGDALKLHFNQSKTEIRSPVIVRSAPALIHWIENHPLGDNKNAPLWVKVSGGNRAMDYATAAKVLKDLKRRSGLDKPVNPHQFRKSSASYFAQFLSDQETKKRFGWTPDSSMLQIYCHMDEERINDKIMGIEGVKKVEVKKEEEVKAERCKWCNKLNPAGQEYCVLCKRPLNADENLLVSQIKDSVSDGLREFVEDNPEMLNSFLKFMKGKVGV